MPLLALMTPVSQAVISFSSDSYASYKGLSNKPPPNVGRGIGMSFGLIGLMMFSSICSNQAMYRMAATVSIQYGFTWACAENLFRGSTSVRAS